MNTAPDHYKEAVRQSHREAFYTLVAALFLFVFFWASIYLCADSDVFFWGLPLWFWLSCVGGYVLSVVVVAILVKFFTRHFSLDHQKDTEP